MHLAVRYSFEFINERVVCSLEVNQSIVSLVLDYKRRLQEKRVELAELRRQASLIIYRIVELAEPRRQGKIR